MKCQWCSFNFFLLTTLFRLKGNSTESESDKVLVNAGISLFLLHMFYFLLINFSFTFPHFFFLVYISRPRHLLCECGYSSRPFILLIPTLIIYIYHSWHGYLSLTAFLQAWVELHKFRRLVIYGHFHFLITDMVLFFAFPTPTLPNSQGSFHLFCFVLFVSFLSFAYHTFFMIWIISLIFPFKFLIFEDFLLGSIFMFCTQELF